MLRILKPSSTRILPILCLILPLLFFGCSIGGGGTEVGNPTFSDLDMATFAGNDELKAHIVEQYAKSALPQSLYGPQWEAVSAPAPGDTGLDSSAATDYSTTNLQEAGVDEADLVKSDGLHLYVSRSRGVTIVNAQDPDALYVSSTVNVDGSVTDLFLHEKILIILFVPDDGTGQPWPHAGTGLDIAVGFPCWLPVNIQTGVRFVDITDPLAPVTLSETIMDGTLVSSRIIDANLHLIQQFLPDLPPIQYVYDDTEDPNLIIQANQALLADTVIEDLVPEYHTVDSQGNTGAKTQMVAAQNIYKPSEDAGGSMVTLATFDLTDFTGTFDSMGVLSDVHTIYASTRAIYLASTRWDSAVFEEKSSEEAYSTYLYKLAITAGGTSLEATGTVTGRILNQFSLGEHEDILRMATTTGDSWQGNSANHIFCLENQGGSLKIIGRIDNIAPGEEIYAARFMGDRGFLVTFVQIDPLFTLDLSDPENPMVAGELKVPGYSDYIHPLGENHLLTIGKNSLTYQESAYYQGLQLSIFDITDFSDPKLLFSEAIGDRGTHSEALYNHKAFTYWASQGKLAIPVDLYSHEKPSQSPWDYGSYQYSGLWIYDISVSTGFDLLGTLKLEVSGFDSLYFSTWMRGLFIDESVFCITPDAIATALFNNIEATANTIKLDDL